MKDFIDGKIAVWCETQDEATAFLRLCEKYKLIHPAPEGWFFPESELPCEMAVGFIHPYMISFSYIYGSHHGVNAKKWTPVKAGKILGGYYDENIK